jgi:hypothetical protein
VLANRGAARYPEAGGPNTEAPPGDHDLDWMDCLYGPAPAKSSGILGRQLRALTGGHEQKSEDRK